MVQDRGVVRDRGVARVGVVRHGVARFGVGARVRRAIAVPLVGALALALGALPADGHPRPA